MKRILSLCFCLKVIFSFAQEVKTQKDILRIPNTDLVKDFNLKTNGSIKPIDIIKVTYTDIGFLFEKTSFKYLESTFNVEKYNFKDGLLVKKKNEFYYGGSLKPNTFNFVYTYDAKGTLKTEQSQSIRTGKIINTEETSYIFDAKKNIKEKLRKSYGNIKSTKYKADNNKILFSYSNVDKTLHLKNGVIIKEEIYNKGMNKTFITNFTYNNNGLLEQEDKGNKKVTSYLFDKNNNVIKKINKDYDESYQYIFDKYGNWIIAYNLNTTDRDYNGKKTKTDLYGSKYNFYIRQIKYSNGEVTGSVDIKNKKTKSDIVKLRTSLYSSIFEGNNNSVNTKTSSNSNKKVTFKKLNNGANFNFLIDGNKVGRYTKNYYMNNDLLVYYPAQKQLYICKDFKNKPDNTLFDAEKTTLNITNGYWFKTPKGGVQVFTENGDYIKETNIYKYASNKVDVIFQGKNQTKKVLLKNYSTVQVYKVYPVYKYSTSGFNAIADNAKNVTEGLEKLFNDLAGKCLRGNCKNGYGEFEDNSGNLATGFWKNGKPNGPMRIVNSDETLSITTNFDNSFSKSYGMTYQQKPNHSVMFFDKKKNVGVFYEIKSKKLYKSYNYNGVAKSKTLMKKNTNGDCTVGNCYDGVGIQQYPNAVYLGTYKNGRMDGFGDYHYDNGDYYIGEFKGGYKHGLGTYYWKSGNKYIGYWHYGDYQGKGAIVYANGSIKAGLWSKDKLIERFSNTNSTTKKTTTKNYKLNTSVNLNSLSTEDKNEIQKCAGNSKCVANYFNNLYNKNKDKADVNTKMRGYFLDLYKMNPTLAYSILFKIDMSVMKAINVKSLPKDVQTDIKNRAQKLMNGYQKHIKKQGY